MLSCTSIPVMWNHGTTPSITSAGPDAEEGAHQLAVGGDVAVGELGALGRAGRAGGVLDQRGIVRARGSGDCGRGRGCHDGLERPQPAARPPTGRPPPRAGTAAAAGWAPRAGSRDRRPADRLDRGRSRGPLHDRPTRVGRHEHPGARVLQLVLELVALCIGIERDGDGPRLERAEVGHGELGTVLEVERDPVARPDPAAAEPAREAVARVVELGEGDLAPVEHQRGPARDRAAWL